MKLRKINMKLLIIAGVLAFGIGSTAFSFMFSYINPESDLSVKLVGIDTDLGITTIYDKDNLAEVTTWHDTQIWIDPDIEGTETFEVSGRAFLLPLEGEIVASHANCYQPDIIGTLTEPIPVVVGDPVQLNDQPFELHKTTWEVVIKTAGDTHADTIVGEIATQPAINYGFLGGANLSPVVGKVWKGNVYVEYEISIPGSFIYEGYINRVPIAKPINEDLSLDAGDIPGIAIATHESQSAVTFFKSIDGGEITDIEALRTNRGVIALSAELGVGADSIIDENLILPDVFKGWNLYDVYVQYQIAVIVAVPIDPITKTTPEIQGSQREADIGDPIYYRTNVKDAQSNFSRLFDEFSIGLTDFGSTIKFILLMAVTVVVGAFALWAILKLMGGKQS